MFTIFAHLGHNHSNTPYQPDALTSLDPYMMLVVGSGLVIITLLLIILYFLMAWQPKAKSRVKSKAANVKPSSGKSARKAK